MRLKPLILWTFGCALLAACGSGTTPPGMPSSASAPATRGSPRIVSTVPAATYNLLLIGAGEQLVGVSKYDVLYLPEEKRGLPVVGDYESKNYELIVSLKPTAIVVQAAANRIEPRLKEIAEKHGIEIVNIRLDHVEDIWTSVRALGKAAGRGAEAARATERAKEELKEVAKEFSNGVRPKVLYVVSLGDQMAAGGDTFIDEMITLAGGENVGARAGKGFFAMGREAMVNVAPDVLLIGAPDQIDAQPNDPRIAPYLKLPVPAAKQRRVHLVTDGNALAASVNIAQNVRMLAELIHKKPAPAGEAP